MFSFMLRIVLVLVEIIVNFPYSAITADNLGRVCNKVTSTLGSPVNMKILLASH